MAKLRFYIGCIVGGSSLIMFNVLTQSPAIFFAFLAGSVCSGILSTVLMGWMMVSGHMVMFQNMVKYAEDFLSNREIPAILTGFIRSMNPRNESKSFIDIIQRTMDPGRFAEHNDINRPWNPHPAKLKRKPQTGTRHNHVPLKAQPN